MKKKNFSTTKKSRYLSIVIILLVVITIGLYIQINGNSKVSIKTQNGEHVSSLNSSIVDAQQIVEDMKIGWNLGNTLDSPDGKNRSVPTSYYETLWENPVTTEAMIKKVKEAGFNAVRVPVTWFDHVYLSTSNGKNKNIDINNLSVSEIKNIKIEEDWMSRVKEVVDYVDQNNMYCILNVHHDVGTGSWPWIFASTDSNKKEKYEAVMEMLWTQIAKEFKDYGVNVLFEGYNEIMVDGAASWVGSNDNSVTTAHLNAANDLNQIFVNVVRNSGGNNSSRFLILNTYGAEALSQAIDGFSFPTDTVSKHLIISAHVYDWGGSCTTGTNNTIYNSLQRLKAKADAAGAAAIIGEFGTRFNQAGSAKASLALNYYVRTAKNFGITCFVWDDGMGKNSTMQLLNRDELTWKHPLALNALIKGSQGQSMATSEIDTSIEPTKLTLDKTNITVDYDSTYRETISALIEPTNAGKSTAISWKSSNTDIVYVGYDGNIAPKGIPELINIQGPFAGGKEGTATITATITKEDKTTIEASCQVTVKNKELGKIENVNLSDFNNWRKGFYDWQKGYYFANGENRICVNGYLEAKPNTTYTATISDSDLVYTIRELNADHEYITTSQNASNSGIIKNGDQITTSSETKFLAVSLHKRDASGSGEVTMTTSDFENVFKNSGFKLALTSGGTTSEDVAVTGVTVTPENLILKEGESKTLTAEVQPTNATNKNITWKSTSPNVATVSNGVVKAINAGTTTITATTANGKTATCNVTVTKTEISPENITLSETNQTLDLNGTKEVKLTATITPSNANTNTTITWTSSSPDVATVNNGMVTAIKVGTTTITATTANGKTATCKVTVINTEKTEISPENITLSETNQTLDLNGTKEITLKATITPSNANANTAITWTSSSPDVATVNNGKITAIKVGTTTITARTANGKTATCKVTVINTEKTEISPENITLSETDKTLDLNGTKEVILTATITPSNANTNTTITWTSSSPDVATVNNGMVTAIKVGTTTITATTANGKTATCKVTVINTEKTEISPENITLSETNQTLDLNGTKEITLKATITPSNANANTTITWTSSNPDVATVNDGKITAIKEGVATITATTENGKTATCKVTVVKTNSVADVKVEYSTSDSNVEKVTVTISSDVQLNELSGWVLSEDKLSLSKEYYENTNEEVTVTDINGNTTKVNVVIENIKEKDSNTENDKNNEDTNNDNNFNIDTENKNTMTNSDIADTIIPKAGRSHLIVIAIIIISISSLICYNKLKKYREI